VTFELLVRPTVTGLGFLLVESVDEQVVEEQTNMIFSPFMWLGLGNFGLCLV